MADKKTKEQPKEAGCEIRVADDKLKAHLVVRPGAGGAPPEIDRALDAIRDARIPAADRGAIAAYLKAGQFAEPLLIAEGTPAQDGKPGKLECLFAQNTKQKLKEDKFGRVDFHQFSALVYAKRGEALVKKIPPEPGRAGRNVFGETIDPRPGAEAPLDAGKNIEVSPDGSTYTATAAGNIVMLGRNLSVDNVLMQAGDIDFSVGNIDFDGTVSVKGVIKEGFTVKATGDVIAGAIQQAEVHAEGSIVVERGILGSAASTVSAKKNVTAKFIENARVKAGGNVFVSEAILHSEIEAGGSVVLRRGKRRMIIGGVVSCGGSVEAAGIGSEAAPRTVVEVGEDPELRRRRRELNDALRRIQADMEKPNQSNESLAALAQERDTYRKELNELGRVSDSSAVGTVNAQDAVHPGAQITIRDETLQIDKLASNVRYSLNKETREITSGPFQQLAIE